MEGIVYPPDGAKPNRFRAWWRTDHRTGKPLYLELISAYSDEVICDVFLDISELGSWLDTYKCY